MSLKQLRSLKLHGATFTERCLPVLLANQRGLGAYIDPKVREMVDAGLTRPQIARSKEPAHAA